MNLGKTKQPRTFHFVGRGVVELTDHKFVDTVYGVKSLEEAVDRIVAVAHGSYKEVILELLRRKGRIILNMKQCVIITY